MDIDIGIDIYDYLNNNNLIKKQKDIIKKKKKNSAENAILKYNISNKIEDNIKIETITENNLKKKI